MGPYRGDKQPPFMATSPRARRNSPDSHPPAEQSQFNHAGDEKERIGTRSHHSWGCDFPCHAHHLSSTFPVWRGGEAPEKETNAKPLPGPCPFLSFPLLLSSTMSQMLLKCRS